MKAKNFIYIFIALIISVSFAQCSKDSGEEEKKEEQKESNRREDYDNGYYIGEFNEAGRKHGQGTYYWNSGARYEGQWQNSKRHGYGKMIYEIGNVYEGNWENDVRHGQGTYTWPSSAQYVGNWLNSKRNGQGKMTYDGGYIYEGIWKDDIRQGQGTFTAPDGSTFTCEWKDDKPTDEKCYLLWHLKDWYFWYSEIGKIDAKDYTSAEDLLAKNKYRLDNFSKIEEISTGQSSLFLSGKELGYGFGMRWDADNNLRVAYIHSNSPGGINGLKRGWKITHIDGGDVTAMANIPSNVVNREGLTRSFTVEDEKGTSKTIFLSSSIYNEQTVMHNSVIQHNKKAIGYLALRSFIRQSPDALLSAASSLASSGVNELTLDLRYCSGGSYSVLNDFIGIIAPSALNNLAYMKMNYNNRHTDSDSTYVIRKTGSLNLSRIFVITSTTTTNLSEYLINGLSPYMNIIQVGDKTGGDVYAESYWEFEKKRHYLVTCKVSNAQNESPVNGISPDCYAGDGVDKPWGDETDDCLNAVLFYIDNGFFPATVKSSSPLLKNIAVQNAQIIESVSPAEALPAPKEAVNNIFIDI